MNLKIDDKNEKKKMIFSLKMNTPVEDLCEGLPNEFA